MGVRIKFDSMDNIQSPTLILATRKGKKLGSIPAYNIIFKDCLNSYSELSFRIDKYDNGEECRLWNDVKDFKLIYCKEWNLWFEIYVDIDDKGGLFKNVIGRTVCESELSQVNLYDIEINTEIDISRDDYTEPTIFYNNDYPECSLLNRITEKIPHYTIEHVDSTLKNIQKTYTFDNISIYDAFQEIATEVGCLFVFDSGADGKRGIARRIAVYDLYTNCTDCGYRGEYTDICPKCGKTNLTYGYGKDTGIFVSSENLADEITYSVNTDSVKNCFKVEGGDDLMNATVRNCNPNGTDYIWYISNDIRDDMSDELVSKLEAYDTIYQEYNTEREITLLSTAVTKYNTLVKKYISYKDDLNEISSSITGYSGLMNAYYDTIDFSLFLQSGLMPSPTNTSTDAEVEAGKLTHANISPVAVMNIDTITKSTAENAVLAVAKTLVNVGYQVKLNSSSLTNTTWNGNFVVTNAYNENDEYISNIISVTINENMEQYAKQKIKKALYNNDTDDMSITGLFDLDDIDLDSFEEKLKGYCLDSLLIFNDSCQSVLDILIEQGYAADSSTDVYSSLYYPYYERLRAIQDEIDVRENEIATVIGEYNSNGDLTVYGLQNYIIEKRDEIQSELNFQKFIGADYWREFCSYRRDDKYSNSNYISDGLDNSELFKRARELLEAATTELYKSAELQHTILSSLKNLLAIKEFQPLTENFETGNWLRMKVDDSVYKLRLLTYEIDYDNPNNIYVEFSDVMKILNGLSDVQSIFKQAGSIATSYDSVMHQASQGSSGNKRLSEWVDKGLSLTNMKIVSGSDNQEITWDNHGFLMREYFPVTDDFSEKQLKIINKGLYVTDDTWKTSRAGIGNFMYYDPRDGKEKEAYGVIADTLIGNLILGEEVGIYTSTNDITLNKDGLMITNKNIDSVDNSVTIAINPNDSTNGVFLIKNKDDGMLMQVDINGRLIIGDNGLIVDNDGTLTIGDGNFVVNPDGTARIENIVMGGNITWDAENNPVKVLYASSNLSAPTNSYSSYPSSSSTGWHKTYNEISDYYASYSYDNGATWTSAVKIRGTDGSDGSDAHLPGYIQSTYIDFTKVESPEIIGNFIMGGEVSGGSFIGGEYWNSEKKAYFTIGSSTGNYGDFSLYSVGNTTPRYQIYDNATSIAFYVRGTQYMYSSGATTYPLGTWDFSNATVTGLGIDSVNITFG